MDDYDDYEYEKRPHSSLERKEGYNKLSRYALLLFSGILSVLSSVMLGIAVFAPSWWVLQVIGYGEVSIDLVSFY
jgi:hypothetical protein